MTLTGTKVAEYISQPVKDILNAIWDAKGDNINDSKTESNAWHEGFPSGKKQMATEKVANLLQNSRTFVDTYQRATNFPSIVLLENFDYNFHANCGTSMCLPCSEMHGHLRVGDVEIQWSRSVFILCITHKIRAEFFLYGFCHKGTKVDLEAKISNCRSWGIGPAGGMIFGCDRFFRDHVLHRGGKKEAAGPAQPTFEYGKQESLARAIREQFHSIGGTHGGDGYPVRWMRRIPWDEDLGGDFVGQRQHRVYGPQSLRCGRGLQRMQWTVTNFSEQPKKASRKGKLGQATPFLQHVCTTNIGCSILRQIYRWRPFVRRVQFGIFSCFQSMTSRRDSAAVQCRDSTFQSPQTQALATTLTAKWFSKKLRVEGGYSHHVHAEGSPNLKECRGSLLFNRHRPTLLACAGDSPNTRTNCCTRWGFVFRLGRDFRKSIPANAFRTLVHRTVDASFNESLVLALQMELSSLRMPDFSPIASGGAPVFKKHGSSCARRPFQRIRSAILQSHYGSFVPPCCSIPSAHTCLERIVFRVQSQSHYRLKQTDRVRLDRLMSARRATTSFTALREIEHPRCT
ncbi:hypothetical protein C8R45DRAFT_1082710 [Mycena sanguinolenta]|nr:hypothetical protein C8R45DRAFT_1082710 [Mycena sanguinolenta]